MGRRRVGRWRVWGEEGGCKGGGYGFCGGAWRAVREMGEG